MYRQLDSSKHNSRKLKLSHLPMDKMAAISQKKFSYAFSWRKVLYFFYLKFVSKGAIDNNPELV